MGQLQAIKVGQRRIVLNNVYFVYESTNDLLVKNSDGSVRIGMPTDEFFSDIEVSVYFIDDSSIRFFADEARDFLRQFDALTGIEETVAVVEPKAAPETGTLRDAFPYLAGHLLQQLEDALDNIVVSAAPESAKSEATALQKSIRSELKRRATR